MRPYLLVLFALATTLFTSCRTDFDFTASDGKLAFSRDTVYLDTVFTHIGSSTYNLKVYNRSKNDISIPVIQFGKGALSKYRMTVDGMTGQNGEGKIFNNVELLAKDSLFIFIEVTANVAEANPTDFLYTDQIQFDGGTQQQNVELVTLIQDAVFLYPQKLEGGGTETLTLGEGENAQQIYGFFLDENDPVNGNEYHLNNNKPYVIYGYAAVAGDKELVIDAGARLHFHAESGIIVAGGGKLTVNGLPSTTEAMENEVIFEGDRLEPLYSDVPGQWGTLWLTSGSTAEIHHATIKNNIIGLLVENNSGQIAIDNSRIQDCSNVGLLARTGNIKGKNLVINNAGQAALACTYGGTYNFNHCTFNNNWPATNQRAVLLSNYIEGANPEAKDLTEATFNNCIIFGPNQIELELQKHSSTAAFNYFFNHNLIKFNDSFLSSEVADLYQFATDTSHYQGNVIAKNSSTPADFRDVGKSDLQIGLNSAAKGIADPTTSAEVPADLNGTTRLQPADAGAFQAVDFEEN